MSIPNLHDFLDEQEGVKNERFVIEDESAANWALRKIKRIEDERKSNLALAEAEIEKIEYWLSQVNEKADSEIQHFEFLLKEYAEKCKKENPKFKSLKLPNGKIAFRKQQPKWSYDDEQLLNHLKVSGKTELIRVKEEPDKATIKKSFVVSGDQVIDPSTGEIVSGIEIEYREDAFKVEV